MPRRLTLLDGRPAALGNAATLARRGRRRTRSVIVPRLIAMLDGRPTALGEIAAPANAAETRAGEGVDTNLSNIIETTAQRKPATGALT